MPKKKKIFILSEKDLKRLVKLGSQLPRKGDAVGFLRFIVRNIGSMGVLYRSYRAMRSQGHNPISEAERKDRVKHPEKYRGK